MLKKKKKNYFVKYYTNELYLFKYIFSYFINEGRLFFFSFSFQQEHFEIYNLSSAKKNKNIYKYE